MTFSFLPSFSAVLGFCALLLLLGSCVSNRQYYAEVGQRDDRIRNLEDSVLQGQWKADSLSRRLRMSQNQLEEVEAAQALTKEALERCEQQKKELREARENAFKMLNKNEKEVFKLSEKQSLLEDSLRSLQQKILHAPTHTPTPTHSPEAAQKLVHTLRYLTGQHIQIQEDSLLGLVVRCPLRLLWQGDSLSGNGRELFRALLSWQNALPQKPALHLVQEGPLALPVPEIRHLWAVLSAEGLPLSSFTVRARVPKTPPEPLVLLFCFREESPAH